MRALQGATRAGNNFGQTTCSRASCASCSSWCVSRSDDTRGVHTACPDTRILGSALRVLRVFVFAAIASTSFAAQSAPRSRPHLVPDLRLAGRAAGIHSRRLAAPQLRIRRSHRCVPRGGRSGRRLRYGVLGRGALLQPAALVQRAGWQGARRPRATRTDASGARGKGANLAGARGTSTRSIISSATATSPPAIARMPIACRP